MKKKYYIYIALFFSIFFLCFAIGIFCTLFIGGTESIVKDTGNLINKFYNGTVIYAWVYESSGYSMIHQIKNFFLAFYFSSSNLRNLNKNKNTNTKNILHEYGTTILKTLGWAALWEIAEKFFIFMVIILADGYPENTTIIVISNYIGTGETVWNTILSDLPQSIIASTGLCTLIYFKVLIPPSYILIEEKSILIILLQFIWIGLSGFAGFTMSLKKSTSIGIIPVGFYGYFCLEIFFVCTLYMGDFYYLTKKNFKVQDNELKKINDLNESYIILIFYLIIQWIGAFNLIAPGFITSNIVFIIFLLILLSFNKRRLI